MKIHRFSLYQLCTAKGLVIDQNNQPFDAVSYSKFKYGLGNVSQKYARSIFDSFINTSHQFFRDDSIFITSSAFKFVPTASNSIVNHLLNFFLNAEVHLNKIKIHRKNIFESDYGNLSLIDRQEMMQKTDLYIDESVHLDNGKIIVVDDIRITGSHEKRIANLLAKLNIKEVFFMYVAEFKSEVEPYVENLLNHAFVKDIHQLKPLFESPCFQLNARICKFLLSYPHSDCFSSFLQGLKNEILNHVLIAIYGDHYEKIPSYQKNFQLLLQVMDNREMQNVLPDTIYQNI